METLKLNENQRAAIECMGHTLVLGGPGTGKTTVILEKVKSLIKMGIEPKRILLLTFTQRAAKEMISELKPYFGLFNEAVVGTFQYCCWEILRNMSQFEGYTLIDELDKKKLISKITQSLFSLDNSNLVWNVHNIYTDARKRGQSIGDYLWDLTEDESIKDKVLAITEEYEDRKATNRYFDLEDLLTMVVSLMTENVEIKNKLKNAYDHILVDETQELNPLQWQILEMFRDPTILFCVCDDTNSIGSSDGVDYRSLDSFESRIPGAKIFRLEENHRSTRGILDLSHWFLSQSKCSYISKIICKRGGGSIPILIEDNHVDRLTSTLIKYHSQNKKWSDIMIIFQRIETGTIIEHALIKKHIPYRFIGDEDFLQYAHIRVLTSLLRLGIKKDELSLYKYLTLFPEIGPLTARRVINDLKSISHPDGTIQFLLDRFPDTYKITNGLNIVINNLKDPGKAIKEVIEELNDVFSAHYENWKIRKNDLKLLSRLAYNYHSVDKLLDSLVLDPITPSEILQKGEDVITLTTFQSAKGMESKICLLIYTKQDMSPLSDKSYNLEEKRRLLYLGMTRAKDVLQIFSDQCNFNNEICADSTSYIDNNQYLLSSVPKHLILYDDDFNKEDFNAEIIAPYLGYKGDYDDERFLIPF